MQDVVRPSFVSEYPSPNKARDVTVLAGDWQDSYGIGIIADPPLVEYLKPVVFIQR